MDTLPTLVYPGTDRIIYTKNPPVVECTDSWQEVVGADIPDGLWDLQWRWQCDSTYSSAGRGIRMAIVETSTGPSGGLQARLAHVWDEAWIGVTRIMGPARVWVRSVPLLQALTGYSANYTLFFNAICTPAKVSRQDLLLGPPERQIGTVASIAGAGTQTFFTDTPVANVTQWAPDALRISADFASALPGLAIKLYWSAAGPVLSNAGFYLATDREPFTMDFPMPLFNRGGIQLNNQDATNATGRIYVWWIKKLGGGR